MLEEAELALIFAGLMVRFNYFMWPCLQHGGSLEFNHVQQRGRVQLFKKTNQRSHLAGLHPHLAEIPSNGVCKFRHILWDGLQAMCRLD